MVRIMTVSEQIIQVINALCEKFGVAIDWTGENVIPYIEILCKKLITYEIGTSIMWMVFWAILSIACMILTKKFYPKFKEGLNQGYNEGWIVGSAFSIFGLVIVYMIAIIVVMIQIGDIIKCTTFPEMYIFEYVSNLIGTSSAA